MSMYESHVMILIFVNVFYFAPAKKKIHINSLNILSSLSNYNLLSYYCMCRVFKMVSVTSITTSTNINASIIVTSIIGCPILSKGTQRITLEGVTKRQHLFKTCTTLKNLLPFTAYPLTRPQCMSDLYPRIRLFYICMVV